TDDNKAKTNARKSEIHNGKRQFVALTSVSSIATSPPTERRTAPAGTVSMLPRRQEGSGQIITKPSGERETAEISSGDQVNEDERQPPHSWRPSAWQLTQDSAATRRPSDSDRRSAFAGASPGECRK